ncbi:MAG: DUF1003 domain-containing protein [Bacteroidota bacterium]|nr:DUF1003 domain-containing protein [Bacteroidota bacterium]
MEKNLKSKLNFERSFSYRVALWITSTFGSMPFLCLCLLIFLLWLSWNTHLIPFLKPFDPYPFPMLTMIVSLFAIILTVAVLISQNREGRMNSLRQQIEFEVNVHAENEITKVLAMLHEIQIKLGISNKKDTVLEEMKETLDIQKIHEYLNDMDEN